MAIEIERKYLLKSDAWRAEATSQKRMAQAYLNDADALLKGREHCSVRIRIAGDSAHLNIKSRELGPKRQEFEYAIPLSDAESLMTLATQGKVDKIRHYVPRDGVLWEIDEFLGENTGLVIAEIELTDVSQDFVRPEWLGKEVTELGRYYNMALAGRPYSQWNEEETAC